MKENIITSKNFEEEILKEKRLVIVDFFAEWCGPCKMLIRILDEIENEYEDIVKIRKVNVDEEKELAEEYKINSIPALIFFKNGKEKKTLVGYQTKSSIVSSIKELDN